MGLSGEDHDSTKATPKTFIVDETSFTYISYSRFCLPMSFQRRSRGKKRRKGKKGEKREEKKHGLPQNLVAYFRSRGREQECSGAMRARISCEFLRTGGLFSRLVFLGFSLVFPCVRACLFCVAFLSCDSHDAGRVCVSHGFCFLFLLSIFFEFSRRMILSCLVL